MALSNAQWLARIGRLVESSVFAEERGDRRAARDAGTAALMAWLHPADEMAAALCLRAAELWLEVDHRRAGQFSRLVTSLPALRAHDERVFRVAMGIVKARNNG